jgi:hypothetical protein
VNEILLILHKKYTQGCRNSGSKAPHMLDFGNGFERPDLHSSCFTFERWSLVDISLKTGQISEQGTIVAYFKKGFRNVTKEGE